MGVPEKVAYLKGLMEGLKIDADSDYGKLFAAVTDVLSEVSFELKELADGVSEVSSSLDVLSDDLADVENLLYDDDDYNDEPVYTTVCPECGEEIFFDESYFEDGAVKCPSCGAKLEFEADGAEEEDSDGK